MFWVKLVIIMSEEMTQCGPEFESRCLSLEIYKHNYIFPFIMLVIPSFSSVSVNARYMKRTWYNFHFSK